MAGSPSQLPRYAPPESDEEKSSTREVDLARMKVNIQILLTPKSLLVEARNRDTVQDVKLMIQGKEGIPLDEFDLGKQLEDHKTLASYDIVDGSVLQLVSDTATEVKN
ncbi:hypothetical protein NL676_021404 [Syzygium grande]|nr:hypothetical protein NL676_021404 [Syzygium grande]